MENEIGAQMYFYDIVVEDVKTTTVETTTSNNGTDGNGKIF